MESQDYKKDNSRVVAGLFRLGIGTVLCIRQFGFSMPYWLFRWPVILLIIGLFIGIRHNFRGPGWISLIIIGSIALGDMINPEYSLRKFMAPAIVVGIGLVMILRPRKSRNRNYYDPSGYWKNNIDPNIYPPQTEQNIPQENVDFKEKYYSKEDYIDSVAIFGSVKKVVVSKDFKGGEMVAVFGGNEIDLSKADITGKIVLDVTQIMGGTKLILPSNWDVKSEMVAFFGGIEDKRHLSPGINDPEKMVLLKGTSIFGGIEIRNF